MKYFFSAIVVIGEGITILTSVIASIGPYLCEAIFTKKDRHDPDRALDLAMTPYATIINRNLMKKKYLLIPALALTIAGAGVLMSHSASAASTETNPMNNLVKAIAQKFNLKEADVQQVFTDQHAQMEQQHEQMMKDHLQQLVTDGKLTQDQANKIITKQTELQTQREANKTAFQNMTDAERKTAIEKQRADLEQWAKDNNIPTQYLMFGFGRGGRGGHGMHGMMHNQTQNSTSGTTAQ